MYNKLHMQYLLKVKVIWINGQINIYAVYLYNFVRYIALYTLTRFNIYILYINSSNIKMVLRDI